MKIALVGNLFHFLLFNRSIVRRVSVERKNDITWYDTAHSSQTKRTVKKIVSYMWGGVKYCAFLDEKAISDFDKIVLIDTYTYIILGKILNKLGTDKEIFTLPAWATNIKIADFFDIKSIKHVLSDVKKIEYKKTNYYKCLQEMNNFNISLDEDILDGFYTSIISFNSITELIIVDLENQRPNLAEAIKQNYEIKSGKVAMIIKEKKELDEILDRYNCNTLFINMSEEKDNNMFNACLRNKNQYISLMDLLETLDFLQNKKFEFEQWIDENIICLAHYKSVSIYGKTNVALKMFEALKKLDIEVKIINDDDLVYKEGRFELINQKSKPEILIICNLFKLYNDTKDNYYVSIVRDDEEIYYFPVNRFFSKTRKTSAIDIAGNIIPFLKSQGVRVMVVKSPNDEERILDNRNVKRKMKICDMIPQSAQVRKAREGLLKRFYGDNYDENFMEEILKLSKTRKYGFWMRADQKGKYINVIEGIRITEGNNRKNKNKIIMYGPCWILGAYVPDSQTIASYLQRHILNYNIENRGDEFIDMNFALRNTIYHEGDCVIIIAENGCKEVYTERGITLESVVSAYSGCDDLFDAVWDMPLHTNQLINGSVATELYRKLIQGSYLAAEETKFGREISFNKERVQLLKNCNWLHNKELDQYLNDILSQVGDKIQSADKVGAIVMNCNPFTNGHKYLIKKARKMVDVLLVFVVQEDKSYFKFEDRIELVRKGTEEFDNVYVFPSGKFMISSMTMAAYFMKSLLQDTELNESDDIELFAGVIAPKLKIKVRFAGSEPIDKFTSNYNMVMNRVLPEYGIEFIEIERKEDESGVVISASNVRKYLQNGDYKRIEEIVPYTTYEFLKKNFFN